ncbi:hypothetical protein [Streptomyces sp. NPDC051162]|uniref:hypothetical protein n=1 Tax=Streptomyces sp. NPDC051162 TaxID=3154747 RepID=UPI00343D94C9
MPHGRTPSTGSNNLRIGAAVAEIEGLYAALHATANERRRERLLGEIAQAGRRLTDLALVPQRDRGGVQPRSRWQRRRFLAARGAARIIAFTTSDSRADGRAPLGNSR